VSVGSLVCAIAHPGGGVLGPLCAIYCFLLLSWAAQARYDRGVRAPYLALLLAAAEKEEPVTPDNGLECGRQPRPRGMAAGHVTRRPAVGYRSQAEDQRDELLRYRRAASEITSG
jgi:hypothetical protein